MPLTDSQIVGLLELVLIQQDDIYRTKNLQRALAVAERILELQREFSEDPRLGSSRDLIASIEKTVLQLKHGTNPVN